MDNQGVSTVAYRDNVSELAKKYGISNDPGLNELDLRVAELILTTSSGEVHVVGSQMNRGGRLFCQHYSRGRREFEVTADIRGAAEHYFAELWERNPEPGRRPLIDAIRIASRVEIIWKKKSKIHLPYTHFESHMEMETPLPDGVYAVIAPPIPSEYPLFGMDIFPLLTFIYAFEDRGAIRMAMGSEPEDVLKKYPVAKVYLVGMPEAVNINLRYRLRRHSIHLVPDETS